MSFKKLVVVLSSVLFLAGASGIARAASVNASLSASSSGITTLNPIVTTPGGAVSPAFWVVVDVSGSANGANPPVINVCNSVTLHYNGTSVYQSCDGYYTINLVKLHNYTTSKSDGTQTFPLSVPVAVNVDASVPCGQTYNVNEVLTSNSGSGVDLGSSPSSTELDLPFQVQVNCAPTAEACSLGYWKNNPLHWSGTPYTTSQRLDSVFSFPSSPTDLETALGANTLLQALNFTGGPGVQGAAQNLLREAVAALLNSSDTGIVGYPLTSAQVISDVNAALAGEDTSAMVTLQTTLSSYDDGSGIACPLPADESNQ